MLRFLSEKKNAVLARINGPSPALVVLQDTLRREMGIPFDYAAQPHQDRMRELCHLLSQARHPHLTDLPSTPIEGSEQAPPADAFSPDVVFDWFGQIGFQSGSFDRDLRGLGIFGLDAVIFTATTDDYLATLILREMPRTPSHFPVLATHLSTSFHLLRVILDNTTHDMAPLTNIGDVLYVLDLHFRYFVRVFDCLPDHQRLYMNVQQTINETVEVFRGLLVGSPGGMVELKGAYNRLYAALL